MGEVRIYVNRDTRVILHGCRKFLNSLIGTTCCGVNRSLIIATLQCELFAWVRRHTDIRSPCICTTSRAPALVPTNFCATTCGAGNSLTDHTCRHVSWHFNETDMSFNLKNNMLLVAADNDFMQNHTRCRAWRFGSAVLVFRGETTFSSARQSFRKAGLSWRPPRR